MNGLIKTKHALCGLMSGLLVLASGTLTALAEPLSFSTFSGPATTSTIGTQWRFDDVTTNVDLILTLNSYNGVEVAVAVIGDDLGIGVLGSLGPTRLASFTAEFVIADTTTPSPQTFEFLFKDFDRVGWYERLTIDSLTSYTFDNPTNMTADVSGSSVSFQSVGGSTDFNDTRAWVATSFAQPVSSFDFEFGIVGTTPLNRGIFLDGNANDVIPNPVTVDLLPPDSDGDGVPDDLDFCPDSILTETVIIDGVDTGVANIVLADGCSIADLIAGCAEDAKNHGDFVSCVAHLTNSLKKNGDISGKDKGKIQSAAGQSDIGK